MFDLSPKIAFKKSVYKEIEGTPPEFRHSEFRHLEVKIHLSELRAEPAEFCFRI